MGITKYRVVDAETGEILADCMDFDIALALLRGYREQFFGEVFNLTVCVSNFLGEED